MRLLYSLLYILFISNTLYANLQINPGYSYAHYKDLWESQGYALVSTTSYDLFDNQSGGNQYSAVDSTVHVYYLNTGTHVNVYNPTATYDGYTLHNSTTVYYETVYRFAIPDVCVEPTTTNIGIYPSQADCTTALQTLSNISSSTSLACGCPTIDVGLTALYADNLVCNQGYYESFVDGKTFCYATPVCSNNQILNDNNSSCRFPNLLETDIGDQKEPLTADSIIYRYENGIHQICSASLASCSTYDKDGNRIDNIPIDGVTYQTLIDAQKNRFINIGGTILAMTAAGVAILGSGGLLTPAAIATAGTTGITAGLFTAGNAFTESPYTLNSEDHDNISATEKGIRIDLATMDFSDPSNAISSTQNAQGNEVYTIENPDEGTITKIEVTPDKIISTKRDTATNEETIINVNKDVLTNPVTQNDFTSNNNLNNVDYTVTEVTPPKINNDGTTTTSSTQTINKTLNTANNDNSVNSTTYTTPETSSTTTNSDSTTNYDTTTATTSSDGTTTTGTSTNNIDYSPITKRLNQIMNQNTATNNKIDKVSKESTQKKILDTIKDLLEKQPGKDDMKDAMKEALNENNNSLSKQDMSDAFLDALNRHDANSTANQDGNSSSDNNSSSIDDNSTNVKYQEGKDDFESKVTSQYSVKYTIFSDSSCGSPQFAPNIEFMGMTVYNPLPIMEAHTNQYYDSIKILIIISATLMGFLSIFRR